MNEELPDYLKGRTYTKPVFSADDKPGGKKEEEAPLRGDALTNEVFVRQINIGQPAAMSDMPRVDWLLKGEPREVQLEAIRRSYYGKALLDGADLTPAPRVLRSDGRPARGWGHFMQMRLGKTPTLLNEFMLFRRDHGIKRLILLSPNSYKQTWVEEAERFGVDVPAMAFESSDRDKVLTFAKQARGEFMLTINYEALGHEKTAAILAELCDSQTYIGGDESIHIKTFNSKMTKAAITLAKECGVRRPMTGKPVTQGPHDLWSQLRFLGAISGFNYHPFKHTFCKMGGYMGKKIVGVKDHEQLQGILHNNAFLARRSDWMTTPGVDYGELPVRMIHEQAYHYKRMEEDFITELQDGTIVTADQAVTKYLKMEQISSGFIIDEMGETHDIMPPQVNPKLQETIRYLREEASSKVVLFVLYQRSMDLLTKHLAEFNPAVIRGAGWHKKNARPVDDEKRRFNGDPNCRVAVCQIQAVRYGHTLMGTPEDPCLLEIWYENNYSLNDRSQGEERPQGSGQMGTVSILDMFSSPHNKKIVKALQAKEDVASLILNYHRDTGILPYAP